MNDFDLGAYGFVFFPPNWTSFKNPSNSAIPDFELIRKIVGNNGYLALAFLFLMYFFTNLGLFAVPPQVFEKKKKQ